MPSVTGTTERGDRTRHALLAAARARFANDGFRRTSVADISRDAGVGDTTAYVHYPNKEALFFAAVDDDLTSLFEELSIALAAGDGPTGLLATVLGTIGHHPLAERLLAGLEPDFTSRVLETPAFGDLRRGVATVLADRQREGTVRGDVSASDLADGVVATVVASAMATVQIGDSVLETFGDGLAAMFEVVLTPDPRLPGPG
ncbi:MAG: TetR/AcrR family transcriptional regulator [Acidimicrobiales bacterium]|nr:TetR/AcrR family transcriptional regulator [Acidimicrobiales bacterium]